MEIYTDAEVGEIRGTESYPFEPEMDEIQAEMVRNPGENGEAEGPNTGVRARSLFVFAFYKQLF